MCFSSGGIWGEDLVPLGCIWAPGGFSCCPFWGGGSVVVDFLFIVTPIVGVCNCSMFCCTLLYVHSSIAIILMGKRELSALLNLSSWCLVMVERLFLAVPRGCLQFVIVVFPDHTHLLFLLLLIVIPIVKFCNCSMFCCVLLCSVLVCSRLDGEDRAGCFALLCLSSWCLVIVVWLFHTMPQVLSAVCDCGIS